MVAELAREDYEDLRASGLRPTLDDFDRLNQLALRLEDGAETTPANFPRIGWAGDIPFYEPTAAALVWLNDYAARASSDAETQELFFFFALAHGRDPASFGGLETPREILRAVKTWLKTVPATVTEMRRACRYAAWGFEDAVAAMSPMAMRHLKRGNVTTAARNMERLERVMTSAMAATGASYADLLAHTPSRLNAMIVAAQIEAGLEVSRDMAKAQVDYSCTLEEIRKRLERERDAGKTE